MFPFDFIDMEEEFKVFLYTFIQYLFRRVNFN